MLQHKKFFAALLLVTILVITGCNSTLDVYASVNGDEITREEFLFFKNLQRFLANEPDHQFDHEDQQELLERLIDDRIFLAEALRRGLEVDSDKVDAEYENFRNQMIKNFFDNSETAFLAMLQQLELTESDIRQLMEDYQLINTLIVQERDKAVQPTDADVLAFYEENKDRFFARGETRRVRHILVDKNNFPDADDDADLDAKTEELINELYQRLLDGEDFAQLAQEYSQDTLSAVNGGEIDFIEKDEVVPQFGQAAFDLEVGVVSEPVKTQYGWHVLEVLEIKPPGYVELDSNIKENIWMHLLEQYQNDRVNNLYNSLKNAGEIEIFFK